MGPASKMFVKSDRCLGQSVSLHTGLTPSQPRSIFPKGCQSWSRSSFTPAVIKSTLFHPDPQAYVTWALQTPGTIPLPCAADLMFHTPVLSSQFPEQSERSPLCAPPALLVAGSSHPPGSAQGFPWSRCPLQAHALTISPITSFSYLVHQVLALRCKFY